MTRYLAFSFFCPFFCLMMVLNPVPLIAGMPSISFTQLGRMRLEEISFFVALFLFASWGVKILWNYLVAGSNVLPIISYRRSLALMGLWGLVFVIVLTMISGARELMTPQAWEKKDNGWTYQIANQSLPAETESISGNYTDRIIALVRLHAELVAMAKTNQGLFPQAQPNVDRSDELLDWKIPRRHGLEFVYVPNLSLADVNELLIYQPLGEGEEVLAIRVNGEVIKNSDSQIFDTLKQQLSTSNLPAGVR